MCTATVLLFAIMQVTVLLCAVPLCILPLCAIVQVTVSLCAVPLCVSHILHLRAAVAFRDGNRDAQDIK